MDKLKQWGVNAALIGEALISSQDIAAKMKEPLMTWVKICGISDIASAVAACDAGRRLSGDGLCPAAGRLPRAGPENR